MKIKPIALILCAMTLALAGCSSQANEARPAAAPEVEAEAAPGSATAPESEAAPELEASSDKPPTEEASARVRNECWSGKDCTGKILSNRDAHNCKVKSRGKSWRSGVTGICTNL